MEEANQQIIEANSVFRFSGRSVEVKIADFKNNKIPSINMPASSVWVFIAQSVKYCSANANATGTNPVEAPKNFFRVISQFTTVVAYSFSFVFPHFT